MQTSKSSIEITRCNMTFDAGHRLLLHESKCANCHGHTYKLEVSVVTNDLDHVGRIVDFSVIKTVIGKWVDDTLDHTMILESGDPLIPALRKAYKETLKLLKTKHMVRPENFYREIHVVKFTPTSENLAKYIGDKSQLLLNQWSSYDPTRSKLRVSRVTLWETPNCYASYVPGTFNEYE